MIRSAAHRQPTALVIERAFATIPVVHIARGNDLIFPGGNERGDLSEPLWLASVDGAARKFHGATPELAARNCRAELTGHPELVSYASH